MNETSFFGALRASLRELWNDGQTAAAALIFTVLGVGLLGCLALFLGSLALISNIALQSGLLGLLVHPATTHMALAVVALWGGWTLGVATTERRWSRGWREELKGIGERRDAYRHAHADLHRDAILAPPNDDVHAKKRLLNAVNRAIDDVLGKHATSAAFLAHSARTYTNEERDAQAAEAMNRILHDVRGEEAP